MSHDEFADISITPGDPEEVFEEIENAGTGNFGVVIKARHRETKEIFAIKQILLTDKGELAVVLKEVAILEKSNHPNIVRYYGTYKSLGKLWIVMEYCECNSVDLIYKIMHRPLPEKLIAYVCREALRGLRYLHEHRRIHRDIKGSNILLTRDGQVKLADFGVSTELAHTLSRRNTFIGTLLWMAPEAIQESDYDEKADLWSLGITVIEMAENGPPRLGTHVARAIFLIPQSDPPTLQHTDQWSPQMNMFIKRLLTKDKNMRPDAAAMLEDAFVQPENIGTQAELKAFLDEVMLKKESMDSSRLRRGEFSSTTSTATFVERSSGDTSLRNAPRAVEHPLLPGAGNVGSGRQAVEAAAARADGAAAANLAQTLLHNGMLLPLPLLSTQDLSFDELDYAERRASEGGPMSSKEVFAVLAPSTGPPVVMDEGVREIGFVMQGTRTLQSATKYYEQLPHTRAVSAEEANKAIQMRTKYGTVLKNLYHI